MKICLYGAGSSRINEEYKKTGYLLGCEIANRGHSLIFGGGSTGMMGAVSKGVNDNNGRTVGIAPQWMDNFEGISDECDRFIKTEAMEDRKRLFILIGRMRANIGINRKIISSLSETQ